jgi:hypothetical protein
LAVSNRASTNGTNEELRQAKKLLIQWRFLQRNGGLLATTHLIFRLEDDFCFLWQTGNSNRAHGCAGENEKIK